MSPGASPIERFAVIVIAAVAVLVLLWGVSPAFNLLMRALQ